MVYTIVYLTSFNCVGEVSTGVCKVRQYQQQVGCLVIIFVVSDLTR